MVFAWAQSRPPVISALLAVIGVVVAWPAPTHWLRSAPVHLPPADAMDAERIEQLMREMSKPRDSAP